MSRERDRSISDSLVLEDTKGGVVIKGITDDDIAAKSGLQAGDEIVAATIHLDHLNKDQVLGILKVMEPYDSNMKVLTKKELNPSAGLGSLDLGLKSPSEMLGLKKDLSLDTKASVPGVSLNGLDGDIKAGQGLGGGISGPTLNGDVPSLSLSKPSADTRANVGLPSFGLTGLDVGGDLDGNLKGPDVRLATPQVDTPSIDIKKPEIKTGDAKFNPPKFSMPHFNAPQIKSPNADANISGDLDVKTPDVSVSRPQLDLKTSDVKLEAPNADLNTPSGKLKWPHHGWKSPKIKGPSADVNAPDVNLSTPKIDGDLSATNINLPKAGITGPDVDVKAPDIEAEAPSGKWWWLPWNWNKPRVSGPKADLDIDASKPDLNLSAPKIDGEINGPDLSLPKANIKGPDVDGPDVDIDPASTKFTWPHKKWKKPAFHGPKADLNADLNAPDVSVPKIDGQLNGPDAELSLLRSDLDVDVPDANIEAPSGKVKFPTLKKPKFLFSGPKVNGPDVDLDAKAPDLSLSNPTVEVPDVDVKAPNADINAPSGKIKFPTLKKPKWSLSGPKVDGPDVDVDAPDLSVKAPTIDGEFKAPDAKLDINGPDVEGPSKTFKGFKFPKFGTLKGPKADIDADVNAPKLDLKTSDLDYKTPDINLSGPKIDGGIGTPDLDVSLPNANLKGPNVDVDGPDVDLDGPDGNFKFPKFKLPKFKGPKVKGPDVDANVEAPDINLDSLKTDLDAPDLSLSPPKIKGGVDTPDLSVSGSKPGFKFPGFNIGGSKAQLPEADLQAPDLSLPDANLKLPTADAKASLPSADLSLPKADLKASDVELKAPDVELDSKRGDFKFPGFKLPKFGSDKVEGPSVKSGIDVPMVSAAAPTVDLSGPKVEADIKAPNVDLKAPNIDANVEKSKLPHFKLPKFNLTGKNPEVDANVDVSPDLKLNAPSVDGGVSTPGVSLSGPEVNTGGISADAGSPKSKLKSLFKWGRKSSSDDEGVNVKSEVDAPKAGSDGLAFKFHNLPDASMDVSGGSDGALGLPKLDTDAKDYVMSKGVRLPIINATSKSGEKVDIFERLRMAKEKSPSANSSPTDSRGEIDLKLPSTNLSVNAEGSDSSLVRGGTFKVEKPDATLDLAAPTISTSDENEKMSLGLSKMLGLNFD